MASTLSPASAPPTPAGSPAPLDRRPQPRLRWVLAIVVVLLLAAVGTGLGLILNYQPLTRGSIGWAPPENVRATASEIGWIGPDEGSSIFRIPASEGLVFRYRISMANRGPLPITITSVGRPTSELAEVETWIVPVRMNLDPNTGATERGWVGFQAFELRSDQEASIELQVTVRGCHQQGTGETWNSQPFSFSVLGVPRSDEVTLPVQITLVGTQESC